MDNEQKINNVNCKISNQYKFLPKKGGEYGQFLKYVMLNKQCGSRVINLYGKLYGAILSKYRYTSLELIVRSAALSVTPMIKSRTGNPVRAVSNEKNEEHCPNLWQCQTIVDS